MADETEQQGEFVDSYEDVSTFALDDEREHVLHAAQTECTFMPSAAAFAATSAG